MKQELKDKYIKKLDELIRMAEKIENDWEEKKAKIEGQSPSLLISKGIYAVNVSIVDEKGFYEWQARSKTLIKSIVPESSRYLHYEDFCKKVKNARISDLKRGCGILKGLKGDIEGGLLLSIEEEIVTAVFGDFLDIVDSLLSEDKDYKDAAAVLLGAVLEDGLKKIAKTKGIEPKPSETIGSLNQKLADNKIYNKLIRQQINAWTEIRNKAVHAEYGEYDKEQVKGMHDGVAKFLEENL